MGAVAATRVDELQVVVVVLGVVGQRKRGLRARQCELLLAVVRAVVDVLVL